MRKWLLISLCLVAACQSAKTPKTVAANASADQSKTDTATRVDKAPATSTTTPDTTASTVDKKTETVAAPECIEGSTLQCAVEVEIVRLTNDVRKRHGVKSELTLDPKVAYVARSWSASMAKVFIISHVGFPSQRRKVYKDKFGADVEVFAENVAMGTDGGSDAKAIAAYFVDMWEHSSGHLENMLGNYKYLGPGVAQRGTSGAWYATQIFK